MNLALGWMFSLVQKWCQTANLVITEIIPFALFKTWALLFSCLEFPQFFPFPKCNLLCWSVSPSIYAILFLWSANLTQSNVCNWMLFLFYSCRHMMLPNLWSPIQTLTWTYWLIKAKMTSSYQQASCCPITSSLPAQSGKSQWSLDCSRQVASAVDDCWVVALWFWGLCNR